MPTPIVIKHRNTDDTAPTTGDIIEGELALNTSDKRLYSRDGSNNIILIGVQDGTGSGNVLYWNGSDWVESTVIGISGGNVTISGGGDTTITPDGNIIMSGLPTSDPTVAGALWNDSGTLKVSAG